MCACLSYRGASCLLAAWRVEPYLEDVQREVERRDEWFEDFFALHAGLWCRVEPRLTARAYLRGRLKWAD